MEKIIKVWETWNTWRLENGYDMSHKKKDYNSRQISFLNVAYKIFINCILSRIKRKVEKLTGGYQGGNKW